MREIKFRGKRLDNGEWVHGACVPDSTGTRRMFIINYAHHDAESYSWEEVNPATVGQYWRTVNKQGLFDGDIIRVRKTIKVVSYREDNACFCLANACQLQDDGFIDIWQTPNAAWWDDFEKEITVLGNIHDNPELIKTE